MGTNFGLVCSTVAKPLLVFEEDILDMYTVESLSEDEEEFGDVDICVDELFPSFEDSSSEMRNNLSISEGEFDKDNEDSELKDEGLDRREGVVSSVDGDQDDSGGGEILVRLLMFLARLLVVRGTRTEGRLRDRLMFDGVVDIKKKVEPRCDTGEHSVARSK